MKALAFFILSFSLSTALSNEHKEKNEVRSGLVLPSAKIRKQMLEKFAKEIERLDGEGLIPRVNRPESWAQTVSQLVKEAAEAKNLYQLGRVFRRLNATYPNLHAAMTLLPELDVRESEGDVNIAVEFLPETVQRDQKSFSYRIVEVSPDAWKGTSAAPKVGDELLSINDVPMEKWSEQNFIFCKYPLREQCELVFFENFRQENLGWTREQPLTMQLKRGKETFSVSVPVFSEKKESSKSFSFIEPPCAVPPERYPGWRLAYQGYALCAFESPKHQGVILIRIRDFMYDPYRGRPAPPIRLPADVELFWLNYWRKKSSTTHTVIFDVIGNPGGNAPIPYYALIFPAPYQEQYTQFKKIREFERPDILESIYWGEKAKDIWLKNIKEEGTFAATKEGHFLPPIAQFCADQEKDCREGLYQPRKHEFKGKIKLLINHRCVSSCVGFVFNFIDVLKDRVQTYGLPDSADSAYARITLAVDVKAKNHVALATLGLDKFREMKKDSPWVRSAVSVSRSTDRNGIVLSGRPVRIDHWVPRNWNQTEDMWVARVLEEALK